MTSFELSYLSWRSLCGAILPGYFNDLALIKVSNKRRFCVETLTDKINRKDNLEAEWQKWYSHILGLPQQRHFEVKLYYHIIYIIELDDGLMVSADICNKVANEVVLLRQIPPGHKKEQLNEGWITIYFPAIKKLEKVWKIKLNFANKWKRLSLSFSSSRLCRPVTCLGPALSWNMWLLGDTRGT